MPSAWTQLEREAPSLHALLLRLTLSHDAADELTQDLLLKLSHSRAFAKASHPGAYARRAAINLAMDWRRARKVRSSESLSDLLASSAAEPSQTIEDAEDLARILDRMGALSALVRDAVILRYVEGASYESVATSLGKTAHQARALCHAGVRQIRDRLPERKMHHEPIV